MKQSLRRSVQFPAITALLALIAVLVTPLAKADTLALAPLEGEQIKLILTGKTAYYLPYKGVLQRFYESGSTEYIEGRPSLGRWRVSGNDYCSQWGDGFPWTCYDMTGAKDANGEWQVEWIGERGDRYRAIVSAQQPERSKD